LTSGVLFAVAKALEEAGTVEALVSVVLGTPSTAMMATLQLCIPVVLVSAFVNDTPVVAMMMPVVVRSTLNPRP
jgi:Na+/H+ antiporter NhaD/arsenite permease-like protein